MRITLAFVFFLSVPIFAQEQKTLTFDQIKEIQLEAIHHRLIRIVEPAILSFQMLGRGKQYKAEYEVFDNCGHEVVTEMGVAWVKCEATPPSIRYFESGPIEDYWGDRVIDVTVVGYDTHEQLCQVDYNIPNDVVRICSDEPKGIKIEPVVIARLSIITKVERYTKKDEIENREWIKRNGTLVHLSSGTIEEPQIWEGDPKSWEIVASKVTYEFPRLSK